MLIASVSDIHTDYPENRDLVAKLAGEIHRRGADLLVIAGDVSHRNDRIERALLGFREAVPRVAYIPGNHDLWYDVEYAARRRDLNTWERYRVELKALVEATGATYLPSAPLRLGRVALVGSCGWYDHSFVPSHIRALVEPEAFERKQLQGFMWSDARFIAFRRPDGSLMSDVEVAREMEAELAEQLEEVEHDPSVEDVIVVTHHQPFAEVVRRTGALPWEFFNAFMGSAGMGRVIQQSRKVRTTIYGHTHFVGDHRIGGLRVFGTPLGYPRERQSLSVEDILRTRIGWIETEDG